jgi:hypothetical protein
MTITTELIFAVVTAVVTGVLGAITKKRVIPSKYVPLQNILIGILSGLIARYFGLFQDIPTAILIMVATALSVGGAYDALQIPKK